MGVHLELLENRVLYSADILSGTVIVDAAADDLLLPDEDNQTQRNRSGDPAVQPVPPTDPVANEILASDLAVIGSFIGGPDAEHLSDATPKASAEDTARRTVMAAANQAPTLTGLPVSAPVYTEAGAGVPVGPSLTAFDPDLDVVNSYSGFEVTLHRSGAPNGTDIFDLGSYASGSDVVYAGSGGATIGTIIQNSGGTLQIQFNAAATSDAVSDTLRAIAYSNTAVTDAQSHIDLQWTLDDNNSGAQGSGGAASVSYTTGIDIVPAFLVVNDDDLGNILAGTATTIDYADLLDNDTGLSAPGAVITDVTNPTIGSLTDTGSGFSFASAAGDSGPVTFDYDVMTGNPDLISQWGLTDGASDDSGNNNGSVVTDSPPNDLTFDGDDYAVIPNFDYPAHFTVSLDFKVNSLNNSLEETLFAQGDYKKKNSLHIWIAGDNADTGAFQNQLITDIRDDNDSGSGYNGHTIDVSSFSGDGLWHNYTIVVEEGVGTTIYLDGVDQLASTANHGEKAFSPTADIHIGVDASEGGFDYHLTNHEIRDVRVSDGFDATHLQNNTVNEYGTATATLNLRNEEVLAANNTIGVLEDQRKLVTNLDLRATDADDGPAALIYQITDVPDFGALLLNGTQLAHGESFTQLDIDSNNLEYHHQGDETATSDTLAIRLDDGLGTHTNATVAFSLSPVNDAPVLTDGVLADIDEDTVSPGGATIDSIFTGSFSDPDSDFYGVAIAADVAGAEGSWQYSTDNGSSWFAVGPVDTHSALVLAKAALMRFVPAANFNGSIPALTVYGIDDSYAGAATNQGSRATADAATRGGNAPLSLAGSTIQSSVLSVNDLPTLGNGALADIPEDSTTPAGALISDIFSGQFSDVDSGFAGIAISSTSAAANEGDWQYSLDASVTWNSVAPVSAGDALFLSTTTLLRFMPAPDYHGAYPTLDVYAVDDSLAISMTSVGARQTADITAPVNTSVLSLLPSTISGDVTSVFDPPYNSGALPASATVTEDIYSAIDLSGVVVEQEDHAGSMTLEIATVNGSLSGRNDLPASISNSGGTLQITGDATSINDYLSHGAIRYVHANAHHHGNASDTITVTLTYGSGNSVLFGSFPVDIVNVNDAPVGGNSTTTIIEDTPYLMSVPDFVYTDPADGDDLLAVHIVAAPDHGALVLDGSVVTDGQIISVADIQADKLWLTSEPDADGGNYDVITYRVQDDGDTLNGGDDLSDAQATMTIDISGVNDAPLVSGFNGPPTVVNEDTMVQITAAMLASQVNHSDAEDGQTAQFRVVAPVSGTLLIGADSAGASPYRIGVNEVVDSSRHAYWQADANAFGVLSAFSVHAVDSSAVESVNSAGVLIDVQPVNDPPVLSGYAAPLITGSEDTLLTVTIADLQAMSSDVEDISVAAMQIQSVDSGTLLIGANASVATVFDAVSNNTIDASSSGYWLPDPNANGVLSAFRMRGVDTGGEISVATETVLATVSALNDPPVLAGYGAALKITDEDTVVPLTLADLQAGSSDVEDVSLQGLVVQDVRSGSLFIGADQASAVAYLAGVNDTVDALDTAYWTPDADISGTLSAFSVRGIDSSDELSVTTETVLISVTAVNDAPVLAGYGSAIATTDEDTAVQLSLADLQAGSSDTEDNTLSGLVVQSVLSGSLSIGAEVSSATPFVPVTNDTINATNSAWWLPDADINGDIAAFDIRGIDSDGAASADVASVIVAVDAVNDVPVLQPASAPVASVLEDATVEITPGLLIAAFNATDVDGSIDAFTVDDVLSGTLSLGADEASATPWQATANDTISAANKAYWTPPSNAAASAVSAFTVSAVDNAGATSLASAGVDVEVNPVNDPPTALDTDAVASSRQAYYFDRTDFGFDDPVENHLLSAIVINDLPDSGRLLYQGAPVVTGQEIPLATLHQLHFIPVAGLATTAQLGFSVRDDGGTQDGGIDLSSNNAFVRLTISNSDLPPVPVVVQPDFQVHENSAAGTVIGQLDYTDPDPVLTLVEDGDFASAPRPHASYNQYYSDGSGFGSVLGGWTVVTGSVDLRGSSWVNGPAGGIAVDLNGDEPGAIEQVIDTVPGGRYNLSVQLSGNFQASSPGDIATVVITAGAELQQFDVVMPAGWSTSDPHWQQVQLPFTATADTTTVGFSSSMPGNRGPLIADVLVLDALNYELAGVDSPFNITADGSLYFNSGSLNYEAAASHDVDINVTEADGLSTRLTVAVEILDVNESPDLIQNSAVQAIVGQAVVIDSAYLLATDVDAADQSADSRSYTLTSLPVGVLTLDSTVMTAGDSFTQQDVDQRRLTYTGTIPGSDGFRADLADGGEDGATAILTEFSIEVYAPLQIVIESAWSMLEGETRTLTESMLSTAGGYTDASQLRVDILTPPEAIKIVDTRDGMPTTQFSVEDIADGYIALVHDHRELHTDAVELALYRLDTDVPAYIESTLVTLSIADVADAPLAADSQLQTDHATPLTITLAQIGFNDTDDADELQGVEITQLPIFGSLQNNGEDLSGPTLIKTDDIAAGRLVYLPDPASSGVNTDTVKFVVVDSGDLSSGGSNRSLQANEITIVVTSDQTPVAMPDQIIVQEGQAKTTLVADEISVIHNDFDLDTLAAGLRVELIEAPTHGELQLNSNGTFVYRHDGGESLSDRFTYRLLDSDPARTDIGASVAAVDIIIIPGNDKPQANEVANQQITTNEPLVFALPDDLFTDTDSNDTLTIEASVADGSALPAWLSFDPDTGLFSGTPGATSVGSVDIRVTATDKAGASAATTFTLQVEPAITAAKDAVPLTVTAQPPSPDVETEQTTTTVVSAVPQPRDPVPSAAAFNEPPPREARQSESAFARLPLNAAQVSAVDFDDKVIKHNTTKMVKNTAEVTTLLVQPVQAIPLSQLFQSDDEFGISSSKRSIDLLEANREQLAAGAQQVRIVVGTTVTVSAGFSIGYLVMLARGGLLLSSVLSSLPAWRWVDPVPVLQSFGDEHDDDQGESLQSIVH